MQLERAQLFRGRGIGRPAQESRQPLDGLDVLALRTGREPADAHVLKHPLTQRGDGLLPHCGACLEVGGLLPLDPQDGAAAPSSSFYYVVTVRLTGSTARGAPPRER